MQPASHRTDFASTDRHDNEASLNVQDKAGQRKMTRYSLSASAMTTDFADDAQHCPACGAINNCAVTQGLDHCWCMVEPIGIALPASNNARCYCRDCLRRLSANSTLLQNPTIPR